jgi:hypothetical protein
MGRQILMSHLVCIAVLCKSDFALPEGIGPNAYATLLKQSHAGFPFIENIS